jgi:hypothetical protein
MENRITLNQFAIFFGLVLIFISCDTTEKDWKNAKATNSVSEFQKFIKTHKESVYAVNAQNAVDSLEWIAILETHNADSLELFLKNHVSSKFLTTSPMALDSIEWNVAFYSRDTIKLREYYQKYPNSSNSKKVKELIWEIQWPPVKLKKVRSIIIYSNGIYDLYGEMMYSLGDASSGFTGIPKVYPFHQTVYIWYYFSKNEIKRANEIGLRPGYAYVNDEGKFQLIRKIDLNKSKEELWAEFGLSGNYNRDIAESPLRVK